MPPTANFAFDGQLAFLTYPRVGDLSREQLRDFLLGTLGAGQFCIARELHTDGEPQLHAVVRWPRRKRLVGATCFDLEGHHPNVQRPRSLGRVLSYVRKVDDSYLDSEPPLVGHGVRQDEYASLIADSSCEDDFLARVRECRPRDCALYLSRLRDFARWNWPESGESYRGRARGEFLEQLPMTEWVTENLVSTFWV